LGGTRREGAFAVSAPVDTAVILAAGMGTRLGNLGEGRPKGFLQVGGSTLIERSLHQLRAAGIRRVYIGTGYRADHYADLAAERPWITCVYSARYAETGSMTTLYAMRRLLDGPFLLLESDLLYEPRGLQALLTDPREDVVLTSGFTGAGDECFVETDALSRLVGISKDPDRLGRVDGELVGISKLSLGTFHAMCRHLSEEAHQQPGMHYEDALVAVSRERQVHVRQLRGLVWCEIDDANQLARAKKRIIPYLAAEPAESVQIVHM
jgi:2-aminoethylphosphonate-pyruvate transaminase